jgi:hypothetical protein
VHDPIGYGLRGRLRRGIAVGAAALSAMGGVAATSLGCAHDEPPPTLSDEDRAAIRDRSGEDQMDLDRNIERDEQRQEK